MESNIYPNLETLETPERYELQKFLAENSSLGQKRTETFGKLASAMHLALHTEPRHMSIIRKPSNPTTGSQKGVYSKILGGNIGAGTSNVKISKSIDDKNDDNALPAPMRALELVRDLS